MLPLSTKYLNIYWHPSRAVVLLQQGLWQTRVLEKYILGSGPTDDNATNLFEQLNQLLTQKNLRNLSTKIMVSGDDVKYQVAPWNATLEHAEQVALVQHQFHETYGIGAPDWQVFLGDAGFAKNQIACAVRATVLDQLTEIAQQHQLTISSMSPSLVSIANYFRKKVTRDAWLISIEHDCMYLVQFVNRAPARIRTSKLYDGWSTEIEVFLARESLFLGDNTLPIYIFWPENSISTHTLLKAPNVSILRPQKTHGLRAQQDSKLVIALCA